MNKTLSILFVIVLLGAAAMAARAQQREKLTLQEAVKLALQNSPDLKLARAQYNVALGDVGVDRAAFLPNVYTGSGAVYTYGFPSIPGAGPPAVFQLDYTESLFNPLLKAQQHAKEDEAKNRAVEMRKTRSDVMVRTALDYLELAKVRHALDLIHAEQASAEKVLEVTRQQIAANQALPIDETRRQLDIARLESQALQTEDREQTLSEQLRVLTGLPEGQPLVLDAQEPDFSTSLQEKQLVDLGMQNDPAIEEAENERAARQKLLHGAKMSYWPTVDLVAQYNVFSRLNNYDLFYKTFYRNSVNAGVEVTIPLFAAKTSATVALAKSELKSAEISLGNQLRQSNLDMEQKYRHLRELKSGDDVARLDLQLAQQDLQMQQAMLQQGKATLADVEQSQINENQKWLAFLDANFALQQGQLSVLEATGQLARVFP
ncbi:MAG TPA: TolC family protein [Candidatus Acidoferrales bacterium]|nr:TolC family protein [Candidatus Acidoferrales bacterium]